jgi:hypothetical protein
MYIDPWGLAGQQSWLDSARETFLSSDAYQFGAGLVSGGLAGAAPFGFTVGMTGELTGASSAFPPVYRMGYGIGEGLWGIAQIVAGTGGVAVGGVITVGGASTTATGGGAVVGIPAIVGGVTISGSSAAAIAEGGADLGVAAGVFMSAWSERPGTSGGYGDVVESGDTPLIITPRHGLLRSAPKHHIFPQEFRKWFRDRGIDIDDYTVILTEGDHAALHVGGGKGKGGGWWNERVMEVLRNAENQACRKLLPEEIIMFGRQLLDRAGLGSAPFVRY